MPVYEPPLDPGGGDSLEDEAARSGTAPRSGSALGSISPHWLILARGRERMVLFRGWPTDSVLQAFQERRMAIGLALTADDFTRRRWLDGCSYVFIGRTAPLNRVATVFDAALRDLARINWTIEPETSRTAQESSWAVQDGSWQVIAGGYQPDAPGTRRRRKTERPSPTQQDLPEQRKLQRVEA